jgi:hypothetical protein
LKNDSHEKRIKIERKEGNTREVPTGIKNDLKESMRMTHENTLVDVFPKSGDR